MGFDELARQNFNKADKIEGIELKGGRQLSDKSNINGVDDSATTKLNPETESLGMSYKNMGYFQFIKMIFTHKKVRNDFLKFIRNGFK